MSTGSPSKDWLARLGNVDDALEHLRDPDVVTDIYTAQAVKTLAGELAKHPTGREQCCAAACIGGACESCRCCSAGWCVTGADGLPEGADDLARWIEVAREHNPIVAAWATDRAAAERLRAVEMRAWFAVVDLNSDDTTRAIARAILGVEGIVTAPTCASCGHTAWAHGGSPAVGEPCNAATGPRGELVCWCPAGYQPDGHRPATLS